MKEKENVNISYQSAAVLTNPKVKINGVEQFDLFSIVEKDSINYKLYNENVSNFFTEDVCGIVFEKAVTHDVFRALVRIMGEEHKKEIDTERKKKLKIEMVNGMIPFSHSESYKNDYVYTTITISRILNTIYGKGKWGGNHLKTVWQSIREIRNKHFAYHSGAKIQIMMPILISHLEIPVDGESFNHEKIEISYGTHFYFVHSIAYNGIKEPSNAYYITRGLKISSWADRFFSYMYKICVLKSTPLLSIKAITFEDEFILTKKEKARRKKNPQREKEMFNKVIARMQEIEMIISGEHEEKNNGKITMVKDGGFYESYSPYTNDLIYNFRMNPQFYDKLEKEEIQNL